MADSLFSQSWYRVADLKPRLRSHAQMHRMRFRGQVWHVLQDHQNSQFHRISPAAHLMISLMNGRRTMAEIWSLVGERAGANQPTQDESIQLLAQLHRADLLDGGIAPDMEELAYRSGVQQRRNLLLKIRNPLALRLPLLDPDRFLDATMPLVRPAFSAIGFAVWLCLVCFGGVLAALNWPELTSNLADRVLSAENILLMLLVYPAVKSLHELGHAYATKRWGGEVHEIGLMFLVLIPVPYVDASASSAFREKRRRAIVGGAGIMVEMALAAAAMIVWANVEPGIVSAVAFNVMLIGGVSTVFFNGNPLLRFDGYYVLCDLVEIPNLGTRANRHVFYLIERRLFGVTGLESPATAPGERGWFVCYALAATVYRLFIVVAIALFVAEALPVAGVVLAVWALANMFVFPLAKGVRHMATAPRLRGRRRRAFAVSGVAAGLVLVALLGVPAPYATVVEGVVWAPDEAAVRARADGVVAAFLHAPNESVSTAEPLALLEDPTIAPTLRRDAARLEELRLRLDAARMTDLVQAAVLREQIRIAEADLAKTREVQAALTLRSERTGAFIVPDAGAMIGRFMRKGELFGYVWDGVDPIVRVVVPQTEIDLVRSSTFRVDVRFADRVG
ncbi:MAG: peptidase M50, partial [Alphaproteobacteria bacterium]